MFFSELNPYVRYARYLNINSNSYYEKVVALDVRLFYVIDGYGKINVKNKEYEMSPNSLIIFNSGTEYQLLTPEHSVTYLAINFDYTQNANFHSTPVAPVLADEYKEESLIDHCAFDDTYELSDVMYIKHIPSLRKKLDRILNEHTQKMLYYENTSGHILAQCLTEALRFLQTGTYISHDEAGNLILSHIHEHFSENLTNDSIGSLFGYHPNYISSLVKRLTGMSIHKYVIHIRLMYAANYLENTSLSCEEIAQMCGFCDMAHFSKCFKNHYGIAPSKYKNI